MRSQAEVQVFRTLTAVLDKSVNIKISCYPKWLINPKTGKKLELDFYICSNPAVAFEVQGPHHITDAEQIYRDKIKKELCEKNGVKLYRIGILQNNPDFFFNLFTELNTQGYEIKLNEPSFRWGIRRTWGQKYNNQITNLYGKADPCYKNPDKFFEKEKSQFYILRPGGKKEYLAEK